MKNSKFKILMQLGIVYLLIILSSYTFNSITSTTENDVTITSDIVLSSSSGQEFMNVDIKWTWSKKVILKRNTDFIAIVIPKEYVRIPEGVKEEKNANFGLSMGDLRSKLILQEGNLFRTNYLSTNDGDGHISFVYRKEKDNTENIARVQDMAIYYVHDQNNFLSKPSFWIKKESLYDKIAEK